MSKIAGHALLGCVILLLGLSIVMLISTGMWVRDYQGDAFAIVQRQLLWIGLGAVAGAVAVRIPMDWLQRLAPWIYGAGCVLLALCFVEGVGKEINGSRRWIEFGKLGLSGVRLQPSEFARLAVVIALAAWYMRVGERSRSFFQGFLIPLLLVAVPVGLIGAEVDIGTAALVGLACFCLMFVAGANLPALVVTVLAGLGAVYGVIRFIPNRAARFTDFFEMVRDPMSQMNETGMQQIRAMMAFANGSTTGVGLGEGQQKMFRLPYAHSDFVFPIIGEELGLVATLSVVVCYALMLVFGMFIALHAATRFGRLVGVGCVVLMAFQATLNIAVTTACLPNKGLPLPLVSYGGSNLLFCLVGVGLLLNLHRTAVYPEVLRPAGMPRRRVTPRV